MKISQLITVVVVLGLGAAGVKYSLDQQSVMDLLVAAHGGGSLVDEADATGLRKASKDLDVSMADAAKSRSDAVNASESCRVEMRDARDKRNDAETELTTDKETLADWERRNEEINVKTEELRKTLEAYQNSLRGADILSFDSEVDAQEMLAKIKSYVEEESKRTAQLTSELEEKKVVRKAAEEKVAGTSADLAEQNAINNRFFDDYCHNADEFQILSVEPRWRVVVFAAGKDSRLVPGDATPLLVKRGDVLIGALRVVSVKDGMVVAEYKPEELNGLPAVGDTVFRKTAIGN